MISYRVDKTPQNPNEYFHLYSALVTFSNYAQSVNYILIGQKDVKLGIQSAMNDPRRVGKWVEYARRDGILGAAGLRFVDLIHVGEYPLKRDATAAKDKCIALAQARGTHVLHRKNGPRY